MRLKRVDFWDGSGSMYEVKLVDPDRRQLFEFRPESGRSLQLKTTSEIRKYPHARIATCDWVHGYCNPSVVEPIACDPMPSDMSTPAIRVMPGDQRQRRQGRGWCRWQHVGRGYRDAPAGPLDAGLTSAL